MPPRNVYFGHGSSSEKALLEDLIIEAIQIHGHDVYYIPRKIVKHDRLLNEDVLSKFADAYKIEMYVENVDGFEGDGKFLSKFGLEIRDQMRVIVAKRRWNTLVARYGNAPDTVAPKEGDLLYFTSTGGLFEIRYVSKTEPFLQLNGLPVFKLTVELFEYGGQNMKTGVPTIDRVQNDVSNAWRAKISYTTLPARFTPNETLTILLPTGISGSASYLSESMVGGNLVINIGKLSYDDGVVRRLPNGSSLIGNDSGAEATVEEVYDTADDIEPTVATDMKAQNSVFSTLADPFISFDETNPFGDN